MKKTKIVASLGPKSNTKEIINELILSGVDVFRINTSHATYKEMDDLIQKIRECEDKLQRTIGIMLDTDGPSIRLDKLNEGEVYLKKDSKVKFYNYHVVCNNTQLSTNYDNLIELVELNDIITLSDGKIILKIIEIHDDNFICQVLEEGIIKSNQTLHIENILPKMDFINSHDRETILYAIEKEVDFLALSHVRDEQDVLSVVDMLIEEDNDTISLISKIENEFAFTNLEEILKVSDGVMVARGDLGQEISIEKVGTYQKIILEKANEYQKVGIVATDLLRTMCAEPFPSRAEVLDIYNTILDKTDALVLCNETTVGNYPVLSVQTLSKIINEAENNFPYLENLEDTFKQGRQDVTSMISYSVVNSSILLKAKGILANTMSGYTARKISHFRPKCLILGLSPNKQTVRSLTLNYGVYPVLVKKYDDTDKIINECIKRYKEMMHYEEDDIVIITGGLPSNNKNTDFMKIEKIDKED